MVVISLVLVCFFRSHSIHIIYRWFCHFDDDMYANIPNLVLALSKTGNETDDGVYFGRWPGYVVLPRLRKGIKVCGTVYISIKENVQE